MTANTTEKYKPRRLAAEDTFKLRDFEPPITIEEYNKAGIEASVRSYELVGLGTGNEGTQLLPQFVFIAYVALNPFANNEKIHMGPPNGKQQSMMNYHQ